MSCNGIAESDKITKRYRETLCLCLCGGLAGRRDDDCNELQPCQYEKFKSACGLSRVWIFKLEVGVIERTRQKGEGYLVLGS